MWSHSQWLKPLVFGHGNSWEEQIKMRAATFGLVNSVGQLGGFAGNYIIGFLNDRTHSLAASFAFIALVYIAAGGMILNARVRNPNVPAR